jgi:ubiquinone biosynthesis protein
VPSVRLFARSIAIAFALGALPFRYLGWLLTREAAPSPDEREAAQGELLAAALEHLGATYVKLGQILGSRPDLLPPGWVRGLARLQDRVKPVPLAAIEGVLARAWTPEQRALVASVEPMPLAAASVAQVHLAHLTTGREIVLKVQRPDAREQIERDLVLMRLFASLADRIPTVELFSLPGAIERFGEALAQQLDFDQERANNRRFTANFERVRGVRFPTVLDALSGPTVLAMERAPGVKATDLDQVGGDRRELAERGGRTILKMVFEDGFVHADLHPGNIFLAADGTMTMLDLGLAAEIPEDMRRPWLDTFSALAARDGKRCAELFYVYAPTVGTSDYATYEREVMGYLTQLYGARLADVEVGAVVSGMMNVLRKHRVQIDPVFTVVNVALLVAEGLGKQLDPSVDLVLLAVPFLLAAQLSAPAGRPPRRAIPAA